MGCLPLRAGLLIRSLRSNLRLFRILIAIFRRK
jgi:hypothetical protein